MNTLPLPIWVVTMLLCSALALILLVRAGWKHGREERAKTDTPYTLPLPSNWPKRTRERDAKLHGLILTAIAAGSGLYGYRWVALACVVIMGMAYLLSWWNDFSVEQNGYDAAAAAEEDACWQDRSKPNSVSDKPNSATIDNA